MLLRAGRHIVNTEFICRVRKNENAANGAAYTLFVRDGQSGVVVSGDIANFEAWLNSAEALRVGLDFIPVAGIASIVKISVPTDGTPSTHYHVVIAGYQHAIKVTGAAVEPFERWLESKLPRATAPVKDG